MQHLFLLHGAIGSSAQLKSLEEFFSARFIVHRPDFPGHGGTKAQTFSIPFFADDLRKYCETRHIEKAYCFGYSMGGYVALYLARQVPQLFEKIVTLATKFQWDQETAEKEVKLLQPEVIIQKLPQFADTLRARHAPEDWKEVVKLTAGMLLAMGQDPPLKPGDYTAIDIPSLIMLGDRDKMVSLEETLAVCKQMPKAQCAVLPGTPHPLEAVDMKLLGFMIERFFERG